MRAAEITMFNIAQFTAGSQSRQLGESGRSNSNAERVWQAPSCEAASGGMMWSLVQWLTSASFARARNAAFASSA